MASFSKIHNEYELRDVKYSEDFCSAVLKLAEKEYIANYIEMWQDRLVNPDSLKCFNPLLEVLRKECNLTIYSAGMVKITSDYVTPSETLEFEFVYSEMKWVFRFIHFALIDSLARIQMGNFDDLKRWGLYDVACREIEPAESLDWVVNGIRELAQEEKVVLRTSALLFIRDFAHSRVPFVFQGPLRKWEVLYDDCGKRETAARRSVPSIKRVSSMYGLEKATIDAEAYLDLLSQVGKRAEFILNVFSNRLTVAGLSIGISAFALGLLPFTIQRFGSLESTLTAIPLFVLIICASFIWYRPVGHKLINLQMRTIMDLLGQSENLPDDNQSLP